MDWMSPEFWSALLAIVVIDLVLAGDNAIVIGLAARNLPKEMQRRVIFWGTAAAIGVRVLLTLAVVWLLQVPGLLGAGGLLLVWIAYKLLVEEKGHDVKSGKSVLAAIRTIVVADAVMGLDNVLAVAGAAHGSFLLVVLGLLVSVPIVVWGSRLILKAVDRFPAIIAVGAAVLAWTASKMIAEEPLFAPLFEANPAWKWALAAVLVAGVLLAGMLKKRRVHAHAEPALAAERDAG